MISNIIKDYPLIKNIEEFFTDLNLNSLTLHLLPACYNILITLKSICLCEVMSPTFLELIIFSMISIIAKYNSNIEVK